MTNSLAKYVLGILVFLLLLGSCKQEPTEDPQDLIGYWEIQSAYRNGQQTESLDELFFEFFEDGTMRTNISGIPTDAAYTVKGNSINQLESDMDVAYSIEEATDSTLTLTTTIRNYNFRFDLGKRVPQE